MMNMGKLGGHPACILLCPPQISLEVTQGWTWGPVMRSQPASNIQWPLCNSVILSKLAFSFHILLCDHLCKVICTHQASLCWLLHTLVACYKPQKEMCLFMWLYCFIFFPARTIADTDIHFKFVKNLWEVLSVFETRKVKIPFLSVIPTTLCIQQNAKLEVLVVVKWRWKSPWMWCHVIWQSSWFLCGGYVAGIIVRNYVYGAVNNHRKDHLNYNNGRTCAILQLGSRDSACWGSKHHSNLNRK
jgi:hypothetical protein